MGTILRKLEMLTGPMGVYDVDRYIEGLMVNLETGKGKFFRFGFNVGLDANICEFITILRNAADKIEDAAKSVVEEGREIENDRNKE